MKQIEQHDLEWASDWNKIVEIYETIDHLKELFGALNTTYLRQMQQEVLIANLEKYAWSLQNYIIEKYSKI